MGPTRLRAPPTSLPACRLARSCAQGYVAAVSAKSRLSVVNAAVRAEPRGVGTFGARDPLAREAKLLGALLGQVIVEQAGRDALDLVERIRRQTIAIRRGGSDADRGRLAGDLAAVSLEQAEVLIRAFSLY